MDSVASNRVGPRGLRPSARRGGCRRCAAAWRSATPVRAGILGNELVARSPGCSSTPRRRLGIILSCRPGRRPVRHHEHADAVQPDASMRRGWTEQAERAGVDLELLDLDERDGLAVLLARRRCRPPRALATDARRSPRLPRRCRVARRVNASIRTRSASGWTKLSHTSTSAVTPVATIPSSTQVRAHQVDLSNLDADRGLRAWDKLRHGLGLARVTETIGDLVDVGAKCGAPARPSEGTAARSSAPSRRA